MNENVRIIRPEKIEYAWTICKKVNKKGKNCMLKSVILILKACNFFYIHDIRGNDYGKSYI